MATRTNAKTGHLEIAIPETKEGLGSIPSPDVKIPDLSINRRAFLNIAGLGAATLGIGNLLVKPALNTISNINARPEPINTQEYDEMVKEFLNLENLEEIYNKHFGKQLDPRDGKPVLGIGAFINTMLWSQVPLKIQYDQIDEKTQKKPEFKDFVDEYMTDICDMSTKVEMRPEVFLITSAISGQNIIFSGGQDEDVQVYKAQLALGAIREKFGEDTYEYMQKELANPDSFIFSKFTRNSVESAGKLLGINLDMEKTFRPVTPWHGIRLDSPTVGSMDLEYVIYAQGYQFIKDHYPAAAEYFSDFPEAAQALEALSKAKTDLEKERAKLKKAAIDFAKGRPDAFEDFFNEKTAEAAFAEIGIDRNADGTFDYSRGSYAGFKYDFENGLVFIANGETKRVDKKERQNFVVDETIKHFLELAKEDKQAAIEALMADQIFNEKFINYLTKKTAPRVFRGPVGTNQLTHFLGTFGAQKRNFMNVREQSYQPLGKLEYDRKFQAALAVATTRMLLEQVTDEFPELKSKHGDFANMRSKVFWQAYFIAGSRELSGPNAMQGLFATPDEYPPYNNPVNLRNWREYFNAFVSAGLIPANAIPRDFVGFAHVEENFIYRTPKYDETNPDYDEGELDLIKKKYTKLTSNIYTGWMRSQSLVPMLMLKILN